MDNQIAQAFSASKEQRRLAFDHAMQLTGKERFNCIVAMLATPYKDIREAILDSCTEEDILNWKPDLIEFLKTFKPDENMLQTQGILVLMQRLSGEFPPEFVHFCHNCLKLNIPDVQYQAFCLAELNEESSNDYLNTVRNFLHSKDEDFRIVAIQALTRLKPEFAYSEIEQLSQSASNLEAFHILLALVRLSNCEQRTTLVVKMSQYLEDERFCFVAAQCLFDYGVEENIPALLQVAKSFFAEPTNRVMAAAAAAKLGSEEGKSLLQKFSQSRHGNPNYAHELLEKLNQLS